MQPTLITRFKDVTPEGDVIELVVWRLPKPLPPGTHDYKYRAVYIVRGERVVGFDNERGKGDHQHVRGRERPYVFTTIDRLIEDFIAAVDTARRHR
ncbi:MAG TPA: DUF6516 family protein [Reyranella sp.]|nr:DUF6516 family protein [Reyranella sp.]